MNQEELKQRLIELIREADKRCGATKQCRDCDVYGQGRDCGNYLVADHLIANGVTIRERGEWAFVCVHNGKKFYKCTKCWHAFPFDNENFCPNCGADMRGVTETEKGGAQE